MDTAEAIAVLREEMDIKQQALADMLGVTITSISRYEHGREPSRQVLKKLADVAGDAKLSNLKDIFTAKWKASITARLKSLRSAGTERSVPLDDLRRWHGMAVLMKDRVREARKSYIELLSKCPAENQNQVIGTHRMLAAIERNVAGELASLIDIYINIPAKKGKNP